MRDTTKQPLEDLKEGYFWLDKSIIKGFDKQGNEHKFYRVKIENSLERLDCTKLKSYDNISDVDLASWQDLIELQKEHLTQLEADSLELIKEKMEKFNTYTSIIPVSMGKDSMLTCHLVRKLYPTKAIFNNTSLDCADTYRMVKTFPNCEIMNPEKGFYQYIKEQNIIFNRISRGCCRIFKVGEMVRRLDHNKPYLMWMGMRNEESNTRSGYQDEWVNEAEWGNTCWQGILPIRKWDEIDVWLYTIWKNIEINSKYKKGYSRVGCAVSCPYYTKSTWILDKYWYPTMRNRWENILKEDFIGNSKWLVMNCTVDEYINQAWNGGVFRDEPTEEVIKEYAKYSNLDEKIAAQYFNKYCDNGCKSQSGKLKRIKAKDVIGMNLKYHGRNISKFYCKKCLMKMYNMDEEKWNKQVESFKQSGCDLF
ncbi:phosphoadenosine phosphosulfate reductase family protein [Butyribacter intestini]|uniref:phosphoadenosine phosphosulfate reductase family protein n=1 Tax=Butyribacter intestini TaxID=1703332 RepID=UPI0022DFE80F|nr:phosphoadenosine phosphosulfate reductase family protein [Butyribacter intestini]